MLYHGENPILQITAVEHLHWKKGVFCVSPRDYASLTFRIRGSGTIDCGNQRCQINANDILYLPQNLGYTATYTDTELLAIHFVTTCQDPLPEIYSLENSEEIYKLFLRIHALWSGKEPAHTVLALSQLYGILGAICQKETQNQLPPHFLKAISYINANFRKDLNITAVCHEAGVGGTAFRQQFKHYYQKTPVEYITQLRLEHARNMIAGGMPIEQAALESGFNDSKYFSRVVKKHLGCTPSALKNYGK